MENNNPRVLVKKKSMYKCWVVLEHNEKKVVTFHTSKLLDFLKFIDSDWSDWKSFIVYDNRVENGGRGAELARFTRDSRPLKNWV